MEVFRYVLMLIMLTGPLCLVWFAAKIDASGREKVDFAIGSQTALGAVWVLALMTGLLITTFQPHMSGRLTWALLGATVLSTIVALPWVRRRALHRLGLQPTRFLHHFALYAFGGQLILYALSLSRAEPHNATERLGDLTDISLAGFVGWGLEFLARALLPLLAVGWLTYRTRKATMQRLGIRRTPMLRMLGQILAVYLAFIPLEAGLEGLFLLVEKATGWDLYTPSPEALVPLTWTAILYVLLSKVLTPAITEELLYRGVLQPRLGILWTSLLFMIAHSQHGLNGLVNVFVGSLVLGWSARRYGIWVSIGMHALHNFFWLLLPSLSTLLPPRSQPWIEGMLCAVGFGFYLYFVNRWCRQVRPGWLGSRQSRYRLSAVVTIILIAGSIASTQAAESW